VINLVNEENAEMMSLSSTEFPPGMSETEALGLKTLASSVVKPPRLEVSPAAFEGREIQTLLIGNNQVVMGELLVVHIRDEFIDAETLRVKTEEMHMIGRMQGGEGGGYSRTREPLHMKRLSFEEWQKREGRS
jgi:flavin reductase (DIM6/NTAB) family NADH-FMN oxidoreductase RutF